MRKIPLNPPLQKGEVVGMPGPIEMLQENQLTILASFVQVTFLVPDRKPRPGTILDCGLRILACPSATY
jgi:hypothetical protein